LLALPPGRWNETVLCDWLAEFIGCGYCLDVAIQEMPAFYRQLGVPKGSWSVLGRFRLHFLPPYSPVHNRIERVWQDVHANVSRNHCCSRMSQLMRKVRAYLGKRNRRLQPKPSRAAA